METEDESKCCREDGGVPECYFNGKVCITENESFGAVTVHTKRGAKNCTPYVE